MVMRTKLFNPKPAAENPTDLFFYRCDIKKILLLKDS